MPLSLLSKLPSKETNGLGVLLAETIANDGTIKSGAEETRYAVVKLALDEHGVKAGEPKAVYRIEHIEVMPTVSDMENTVREFLIDRLEERRANGQLTFDTDEPTLMAELLAEFAELADDLGVEVTEFKASFASEYGHPPETAGEHEIREWLHAKRPRMTGRPAEDVEMPAFTSETAGAVTS